jgi:hypothetical protein
MFPSESIDLFSWYLHEREAIRISKENGFPKHTWTTDPILSEYKFTNILRINDKTTKWVHEHWYKNHRDAAPHVQALNCAIFRYFGTSNYAEQIGYQQEFRPDYLIEAANSMMAQGKKVFTGAYIITNGGIKAPKQQVVVYNYLSPFWSNAEYICDVARKTNSWQAVCEAMGKLPGFGAFMRKEVALDMMLTPVLENCHDRLTWSPAGPGAIRGLNRLMGRAVEGPYSQARALEEMKEILEQLSARKMFASWMPKIGVDFGVTDVQFSLCEVDKYLRVKNGEGRPRSRYHGK